MRMGMVKRGICMKKVILFPSISEEHLIEEANESFLSGDYEEAINFYEKLFLLGITSFELHWNYLISLRNNDQVKDAVEYAKEFSEYYTGEEQFFIAEFAISIMLEEEDYLKTALYIHELLQLNLDKTSRQQIVAILSIIDEQNKVTHDKTLTDLDEAIKQGAHQKAWFLLENIHFSYVYTNRTFLTYLIDPKVHPVIKTKLLELYIYHQYKEAITIEKFGKEETIIPSGLVYSDETNLVKELMQSIEHIEQSNPSLFDIMEELIKQYMYVMYPFQKDFTDITSIREAFIIVGKKHLSSIIQMKQVDDETATHIYNIETCLELYSSLVNSTI